MQVTSAVLGSGDPMALADFYERLLGWTITASDPPRPGFPEQDGWAMLRPPPEHQGLLALAVSTSRTTSPRSGPQPRVRKR